MFRKQAPSHRKSHHGRSRDFSSNDESYLGRRHQVVAKLEELEDGPKEASPRVCKECSVLVRRLKEEDLCKPCSVLVEKLDSSPRSSSWKEGSKALTRDPLACGVATSDQDVVKEETDADSTQMESREHHRSAMITSFYEYPPLMGSSDGSQPDSTLGEGGGKAEGETEKTTLVKSKRAPSRREICQSSDQFAIPHARYDGAFCSNANDVPTKGIELGLEKLKLPWERDLPDFGTTLPGIVTLEDLRRENSLLANFGTAGRAVAPEAGLTSDRQRVTLESVRRAPTKGDVCRWLRERKDQGKKDIQEIALVREDSDGQGATADKTILRVRKDSDDSVGSELSCSPPSSDDGDSGAPHASTCSNVLTEIKDRPQSPLVSFATPTSASAPPTSCLREKRSWSPSAASGTALTTSSLPAALKRRRVSWQDQQGEAEEVGSEDRHDASQLGATPTEPTAGSRSRPAAATPQQSLRSRLSAKLLRGHRASPVSPIQGATPDSSGAAFKMSLEDLREARAVAMHQRLSVMSMELHARTRQRLRPDPEFDPVEAVFVVVSNDVPGDCDVPQRIEKMFMVERPPQRRGDQADMQRSRSSLEAGGISTADGEVIFCQAEVDLIKAFIDFVQKTDPDILVGYEVRMGSWGYLVERGGHLDVNVAASISRMPSCEGDSGMEGEGHRFGAGSELRVAGRVVLNVWRLLRSEVALYSYTFENTMFHVLHRRVPRFRPAALTEWWSHPSCLFRWRVIEFYKTRVGGSLALLEQLDLIGRTSELARLFGTLFYEVLSRGSQFRVESIMLRLAKRKNFVPVSPSIQQRAKMKAPEYIPLVMEPESRFYVDPVVVLDFQSLYPSIIMAYNYCYSTCLGRTQNLFKSKEPYEFGCTHLKVSPRRLSRIVDHITFSPGGIAFLKSSIRKGILPQMLEEILNTRFMVKRSMKLHGDEDARLKRVLHSRQLGLKLIANVTYGYTSANFSGRMPCIEVGDSVVSKGRETLERAIRTIEGTSRWGARVVYGDTDSVFVLLKGRTKEEAFEIGQDMAAVITDENPKPVKLKFEKVYLPCILQTKKRYVGYMFESKGQKEPKYDAKGIETVRRDGCPAVAKVLEKSLRVLFETKDVSRVKLFVKRQFQKVMRERASLQDLTFAREFRGFEGYKAGAVVPALELAKSCLRLDRRSVPLSGERVPYVIVHGEPGRPLIQSVRTPAEVSARWPELRPNAQYYIVKVIAPPLNRCLSLLGADVLTWYAELPKFHRPRLMNSPASETSSSDDPRPRHRAQGAILRYFASRHCAACLRVLESKGPVDGSAGLCPECLSDPRGTVLGLSARVRRWDASRRNLRRICGLCAGFGEHEPSAHCVSLDCPVFYRSAEAHKEASQIDHVQGILDKLSF